MRISRREWLGMAAGAGLLSAAQPGRIKLPGVRIGVADWSLHMAEKPEALELAKKLGFAGVQISMGRKPIDGKLPLDNAERQARYLAISKKTKMAIGSSVLDMLHVNPLKTDPVARKWLAEAIPVAQKLKIPTMQLPLLRENSPKGPTELDQVADILKEFMPAAEKAKVIIGLEDSVSAEDNVRMFDRAGSKYLTEFYDVGMTSGLGFDPAK